MVQMFCFVKTNYFNLKEPLKIDVVIYLIAHMSILGARFSSLRYKMGLQIYVACIHKASY